MASISTTSRTMSITRHCIRSLILVEELPSAAGDPEQRRACLLREMSKLDTNAGRRRRITMVRSCSSGGLTTTEACNRLYHLVRFRRGRARVGCLAIWALKLATVRCQAGLLFARSRAPRGCGQRTSMNRLVILSRVRRRQPLAVATTRRARVLACGARAFLLPILPQSPNTHLHYPPGIRRSNRLMDEVSSGTAIPAIRQSIALTSPLSKARRR